ncbi:MAG: hypothetical protein ABSH22_18410 [Tepidisphaeraceae bacterium]|jgi:hypothetical protein
MTSQQADLGVDGRHVGATGTIHYDLTTAWNAEFRKVPVIRSIDLGKTA